MTDPPTVAPVQWPPDLASSLAPDSRKHDSPAFDPPEDEEANREVDELVTEIDDNELRDDP